MSANKTVSPAVKDTLLPPEQAFKWPRQAMLDRNWEVAARRWAVLRNTYPTYPPTWIQGALSHIEAGEFKLADALLAHARQHYPDNPNTLAFSAELAMRRQAWAEADTYLEQARTRFPGNPQTWMKSSEWAERQGDTEQATAYNRKARQCAPGNPAPFIQYAELAMRSEQWQQALSRWEAVRENFPDIAVGYIRAAEAARQLDCMKDAQKLLATHRYGPDILEESHHTPGATRKRIGTPSPGRLWELIWTKAIFNLRSEVQRNYLSYGWWVLEPLLHMIVYYAVFGLLLLRGGQDYPVFLLTGLIPWLWFSKAVGASSGSILGSQNLMLQVGLPSVVFPQIILLQTTIKQLPVFVLLVGFVWLLGYSPGSHWWALLPVVVVQALLTIAVASAVAALIPFSRDLGYLVPTGLMFLMFVSGIFFDFRVIPEDLQSLFLLNPIAFLLKCYREIFIDGALPELITLAWWGLGSTAACLLIFQIYKRLRYVHPRLIVE